LGQSELTIACFFSPRATRRSRVVGQAFPRDWTVGFAQSGGFLPTWQSHASLFAVVQSTGTFSGNVHAYCRSCPNVFQSRSWPPSSLSPETVLGGVSYR